MLKRNNKDVIKVCSDGTITEVAGLRVSDAYFGVESNQYRGERAAARKELGSMRRFTVIATLFMIVGVSGAPSWAAAPAISVDLGETDRVWDVKSSPKTDSIVFLWTPSMSLSSGEQILVGECRRRRERTSVLGDEVA